MTPSVPGNHPGPSAGGSEGGALAARGRKRPAERRVGSGPPVKWEIKQCPVARCPESIQRVKAHVHDCHLPRCFQDQGGVMRRARDHGRCLAALSLAARFILGEDASLGDPLDALVVFINRRSELEGPISAEMARDIREFAIFIGVAPAGPLQTLPPERPRRAVPLEGGMFFVTPPYRPPVDPVRVVRRGRRRGSGARDV